MRWEPHRDHDGKSHSLTHLHPFRFAVELFAQHGRPARTVTIHVGFGLHVFTCDIANAAPNASKYGDDREIRAFDLERYQASRQLEALVRGLATRKCFFARNENFFTVEVPGALEGHEYRVFFRVRRHPVKLDTVELIVQSAYFGRIELRPRGQRRKPVGFRLIIASALLGKTLKEPP